MLQIATTIPTGGERDFPMNSVSPKMLEERGTPRSRYLKNRSARFSRAKDSRRTRWPRLARPANEQAGICAECLADDLRLQQRGINSAVPAV